MPNPVQSDLHVNQLLTNVSVAFKQNKDDYIADKVFPKVPVQHQSDFYKRYTKSDWRRTSARRRAPGTETPGSGFTFTTDGYYCHAYGVHKDIDDQTRANADSVFRLDRDATEFVTMQLLLKRELDWNATFFQTGVWEKQYTGVASGPSTDQFLKWSQSGSTPMEDMAEWILKFREYTGFKPNKLVMGARVLKTLKNHPLLLDRIKYTQKAILTEDLIASFLDIDQVLVSYASVSEGPDIPDSKQQDAAATYKFVQGANDLMFCYSPSGPSVDTPAAGYTFTWSGYFAGNSEGLRIKKFRDEKIESDRVEGMMTYDQKVVCPDMGVFVSAAV